MNRELTNDVVAIEQLLNRYCHAVDEGRTDDVAALFHEDAVLAPVYEGEKRYEGRDKIREWYARYDDDVRSNVRFLRHKVTAPVIDVDGNTATSRCYLDGDYLSPTSEETFVTRGRYEDQFVKDGGDWFFKERRIIVLYNFRVAKPFVSKSA